MDGPLADPQNHRLMLCQALFFLFYFFCWRYIQDRRADLHQIFPEDCKWTAIEKFKTSGF